MSCFLTGIDYKEEYDEDYIKSLVKGLLELGAKEVVLTGVSYDESSTGILVASDSNYQYYKHEKLPISCHGTGDVYASAFVGAYLHGKSTYEAKIIT